MNKAKASHSNITFDIATPHDMLEKLRREVARIDQTVDREEKCDHVVNAFWSAWHMVDWVWVAMKADPMKREVVVNALKLDASTIRRKVDFAAALTKRYPLLRLCRLVANAAKHVRVEIAVDDPVAVSTSFVRPRNTYGSGPFGVSSPWDAYIVADGKSYKAKTLLTNVDSFWVNVVYGALADRPAENPVLGEVDFQVR